MSGMPTDHTLSEHEKSSGLINDELVRLQDATIEPYKARIAELEAAFEDGQIFGRGFMVNGKHVAAADVMIINYVPTENEGSEA